jgi:hypothetical protein
MHADARGWAWARQVRSRQRPHDRTQGAALMRWPLSHRRASACIPSSSAVNASLLAASRAAPGRKNPRLPEQARTPCTRPSPAFARQRPCQRRQNNACRPEAPWSPIGGRPFPRVALQDPMHLEQWPASWRAWARQGSPPAAGQRSGARGLRHLARNGRRANPRQDPSHRENLPLLHAGPPGPLPPPARAGGAGVHAPHRTPLRPAAPEQRGGADRAQQPHAP